MSYATLDDLGVYLGAEPPSDSQRLLARAADLIDAELISSLYPTDSQGNPTDAAMLAALNKASCQQVEWWLSNGDEFDQLRQYSSYSIEGISVQRQSSSDQSNSRLCSRALDTLRQVTVSSPVTARPLKPGKPTI